jgi:hypothetical protein
MKADRTRSNQEFDKELRRAASCGQRTHPKRCLLDLKKRSWYAKHRTTRLAQLGI